MKVGFLLHSPAAAHSVHFNESFFDTFAQLSAHASHHRRLIFDGLEFALDLPTKGGLEHVGRVAAAFPGRRPGHAILALIRQAERQEAREHE